MSYPYQIKLDNDFRESIMVCQVIVTLDDHLCGYLGQLLAVCRYTRQRACWLQAGTWNYLAIACWTEPRLGHSVASVQWLLDLILAKLVICAYTGHVFHTCPARGIYKIRVKLTACRMEVDHWISFPPVGVFLKFFNEVWYVYALWQKGYNAIDHFGLVIYWHTLGITQ